MTRSCWRSTRSTTSERWSRTDRSGSAVVMATVAQEGTVVHPSDTVGRKHLGQRHRAPPSSHTTTSPTVRLTTCGHRTTGHADERMASRTLLTHTRDMIGRDEGATGSRVLVVAVLIGGTVVLLSGPSWGFWVGAAGVACAWLVTGVAWALSSRPTDRVRMSQKIGSSFVAKALGQVWYWCVFEVLTGRWWAATALSLVVLSLVLLGRRELNRWTQTERAGAVVVNRQVATRTVPKRRKANTRS